MSATLSFLCSPRPFGCRHHLPHGGLNSAPAPWNLCPFLQCPSRPPPSASQHEGFSFSGMSLASSGLWVGHAPASQTHRWAHLFHAWRVCGLHGAIGVGRDVGSEWPDPGGGSLAVQVSYSVGSGCVICHLLSPPSGMNPPGLTTGCPWRPWRLRGCPLGPGVCRLSLLFIPSESRRPRGGLAGTGHGGVGSQTTETVRGFSGIGSHGRL